LVRRFTGVFESLGSAGLGSKAKERKSNRCGQSYVTSGGGAGLGLWGAGEFHPIRSASSGWQARPPIHAGGLSFKEHHGSRYQ
jgi:hypothetical protein